MDIELKPEPVLCLTGRYRVSILVLMDIELKRVVIMVILVIILCFNPCFNGYRT